MISRISSQRVKNISQSYRTISNYNITKPELVNYPQIYKENLVARILAVQYIPPPVQAGRRNHDRRTHGQTKKALVAIGRRRHYRLSSTNSWFVDPEVATLHTHRYWEPESRPVILLRRKKTN